MRFLFSTGSLYTYSIARCFEFATAAGFDGIELMVDHRWDTRQPAYINRLVQRWGIPVDAVHAPLRPIPGWIGGVPAHIEHTLALAEDVGAAILVHHLPMQVGFGELTMQGRHYLIPFPWWRMHRDYIVWLDDGYSQLQEGTEVQLCIENMPAKRYLGRLWSPSPWNTVEEIQHFTSLTMDTTHLGTWGLDPTEVYKRWDVRVKHIHLSNYDGREHRRPEVGELGLDRLLMHLAATDYSGTITIEVSPDALEAGCEDARMVQLLATSLAYCRKWATADKSREER